MFKLITAIIVLFASVSVAKAQCQGCYYVQPNYHVAYGQSIAMRLQDIPGGYERSRYYIDVIFEDENYKEKIPVINGIIPNATLNRNSRNEVSEIILSYGVDRKYDNSYGQSDGYVHYTSSRVVPTAVKNFEKISPVKKQVKKDNKPSAVKLDPEEFKASEKEIMKNGLKKPSDKEVDDLLNKTKTFQKAAIHKTNDDEIDSLFTKPSSVKDGRSDR